MPSNSCCRSVAARCTAQPVPTTASHLVVLHLAFLAARTQDLRGAKAADVAAQQKGASGRGHATRVLKARRPRLSHAARHKQRGAHCSLPRHALFVLAHDLHYGATLQPVRGWRQSLARHGHAVDLVKFRQSNAACARNAVSCLPMLRRARLFPACFYLAPAHTPGQFKCLGPIANRTHRTAYCNTVHARTAHGAILAGSWPVRTSLQLCESVWNHAAAASCLLLQNVVDTVARYDRYSSIAHIQPGSAEAEAVSSVTRLLQPCTSWQHLSSVPTNADSNCVAQDRFTTTAGSPA